MQWPFDEFGEEHILNTVKLEVPIRGENGGGMKSFEFQSNQNAVNVS